MKKTLFLAVLAGAALAGCVKNEEVATNDGSPKRITFDAPVVTIPTKATEIKDDYPNDWDFGVYALHTQNEIGLPISTTTVAGDMYMNNEQCVANKTAAGETPDYWAPKDRNYYWPKNGYLTFAAYAPSKVADLWPTGAEVAWNAVDGFTFTDFTVDATPDNQIDLLYSAPVYNKKKTDMVTNQPYDGITIQFKHALSSIVFTAKTDDGAYGNDKISITNITVNNVYGKGDFAQNYYVGGTTGTAAWTVKGGLENYTVYDGTGVELTATEAPINGTVDIAAGKSRSDLILMPQNLAAADRAAGSPDATVDITYKITYANGETTSEKVTFKLAVKDNDSDTDGDPQYVWEMGKRYTYHITIGLNKIYFNPTVDVWTPVAGEVVGDGGAIEQI